MKSRLDDEIKADDIRDYGEHRLGFLKALGVRTYRDMLVQLAEWRYCWDAKVGSHRAVVTEVARRVIEDLAVPEIADFSESELRWLAAFREQAK